MTHDNPFCPFGHPRKAQPKVLALQISDRVEHRQIGGLKLTPRPIHGVDIHCTSCHREGWVSVVADWQIDSWDGPKTCSCGETVH